MTVTLKRMTVNKSKFCKTASHSKSEDVRIEIWPKIEATLDHRDQNDEVVHIRSIT